MAAQQEERKRKQHSKKHDYKESRQNCTQDLSQRLKSVAKNCVKDMHLETERAVQKRDLVSQTGKNKNNNLDGKDAELRKMCKSKRQADCAEGELLHR